MPYEYADIAFVLLREVRRTIEELRATRKPLSDGQMGRCFALLTTETGSPRDANRVLLDALELESSPTLRSYCAQVFASASRVQTRMNREVKERLSAAYQREDIPLIRISVASAFARWGETTEADRLLRDLMREYAKNPEALHETMRQWRNLGLNKESFTSVSPVFAPYIPDFFAQERLASHTPLFMERPQFNRDSPNVEIPLNAELVGGPVIADLCISGLKPSSTSALELPREGRKTYFRGYSAEGTKKRVDLCLTTAVGPISGSRLVT